MSKTLDSKSLARWRADPAAFIERHLIDPETERRFKLLPAERDFLKYALATDRDGRLLFPEMSMAPLRSRARPGLPPSSC